MNRKSLLAICIQLFLLLTISNNTFTVSVGYQDTTHNLTAESAQLQQPPKSITIINGLPGDFEPTFHPMYDTHSILSLPFDTLVEIDPVTNEVIPSLAKQWVVTNDSRQWTFYIRKNVICHDGSLLNASAIAAAFEMILDPTKLKWYDPETPSEAIYQYFTMPLESIEIIDEFTIRITFSIPYSPFIRVQASKIRIPSLTSYPAINIEDFNWPIGSGPYVLQNITPETNFYNYTFTKFPNYFRGDPPFETLHYLLYWNTEDAEEAVLTQKGEVGLLYSSMNYSDINLDYWNIYQHQPNGLYIGFLSHQRSELTNVDVRLALNYAINKEDFIAKQKSLRYPLNIYLPKSLILDESLWNDSIFTLPYDPELAKTLLEGAGYPRKSELNGYRFSLKIAGVPWMKDDIFRFGNSLDKIGIFCIYTISDDINWYNDFYRGDYDIFFSTFGFNGDWSYHAYSLLNSQGASNIGTQVSDTRLDTYTSLSIQTPVKQEKPFYLSKIVQRLDEYVPHILLAEVEYAYLKTATVESYIWVDLFSEGGIYFNFNNNQKIIPKIIENIEIANQSIYFPFTDGIITTEKDFTVTSEMSYNLNTFNRNRKERGKYFKTTVDEQETEYLFRCYYESNEIDTPVEEKIPVFQWNDQTQQWNELESVVRNSSLNYVEIKVKGDILVRVGKGIIETTFRYLPGVTIAAGILITIATVTVYFNNKQTNYLRRKYELT
ncbi:MAG: ABC transporter substrate-binding protein [Candidatus Hodarchaeales archaeon]